MLGDHIRTLKDGRWTHGIDCGDETILHVLDDPFPTAGPRVQRTYRPIFVAGADAVELVAHRERVYPAKAVVARAWSPIRDPALAAMFRDSEAFAYWCKTGRLPDAPRNVAVPPVPGAARATAKARVAAKKAPAKATARAKPKAKAARKAPPRRSAARKPAARKAAPRGASARKGAARKARRR
jgi:hypothetical protein